MPRTSRFGIRLVNSEPGPMVIMSARAMASSVWGMGPTSGGTRNSSRMRPLLAVILVSPRTRVPSSMSASLDNAYIAGDTQSANFPILGAEQSVLGGGQNAFVTKLSAAGVKVFSTFLGGAGVDHA